MDVQLLNWLNCTAPYFDWPLSTPLYTVKHTRNLYTASRGLMLKSNATETLLSSRTGQRESSHWPLPLRRWLIGQTTWSDRYSMCFDKALAPTQLFYLLHLQVSWRSIYRRLCKKKSDTSWSGVIKRWADLIQQALKIQKLLQRRQLNQYRQNCPWNIVSDKQCESFPYG